MALSLNRDTKLYISTYDMGTNSASIAAANTFEVLVLDGYSFSQETDYEEVTLTESGEVPVRGQRSFNTSISPAEFSITTYIRPFRSSGTTATKCVEQILWEGLMSPKRDADLAIRNTTGHASNGKTVVTPTGSNVHELQQLYFYFHFEDTTYRLKGATVNSAEIDFSIDGIAQITWSGQATNLDQLNDAGHTAIEGWTPGTHYRAAPTTAKFLKNRLTTLEVIKYLPATGSDSATPTIVPITSTNTMKASDTRTFTNSTTYTCNVTVTGENGGNAQALSYTPTTDHEKTIGEVLAILNSQLTGAAFYINADGKLACKTHKKTLAASALTVASGGTNDVLAILAGAGFGIGSKSAGTGTATTFTVPITGGSISLENNIEFLTPEELGRVNSPIGSFTGTRGVSGSMTAYLRAGSGGTGALLKNLQDDKQRVVQDFYIRINIGGKTTDDDLVSVIVPSSNVTIPTISTEDVISTEISFTGLGSTLDTEDEVFVEYKAAV